MKSTEYHVFALLFDDGTAWIGLTRDLRHYAKASAARFGDSCECVLLESFETLLDFPGRAEVYQWRFRLCQEGVQIRTTNGSRTYMVGRDVLHDGLYDRACRLGLNSRVRTWLVSTQRRKWEKMLSASKGPCSPGMSNSGLHA